MRNNLLEFLFGPIANTDLDEAKLGDKIVKIFEEADNIEKSDMAANKKPLEAALRKLGVEAKVENCEQWCEVHFENGCDYREAFLKIFTPEGLHDLAEAGWVPAKCGDIAQSNEPACFKLGFFEIDVAGEDMDDTKKAPDLKKVMGDGRKDDTEEQDRDEDELNPVDSEDGGMGGRQTGVGKAQPGKNPEGKPKGTKNESISEGRHKAGYTCGFCKNKGRFGKKYKKEEEADIDKPVECFDAYAMVDRLLEMTSASGIPPVSEPPLSVMRPPQVMRAEKLRKKRLAKTKNA